MKPREIGIQFGRQVLRGLSQCAFQANELTGALFVVAVASFNWRMAVFFVTSAILATLVARLLKGVPDLLDQGLYGFNSALMGLALGNFFTPSTSLWLLMVASAVITAVVTIIMAKWLRIPFLAAPFILTFWAFWPLAEQLGLTKIEFGAFPHAPVEWATAIISALGSTLFATGPVAGLIFLCALAISNWRHAIVAVLGSVTAVALVAQAGAAGTAINSGFAGFNGVLGALAAYIIIAPDLRLVAFGAVFSTWLASYVYRGAPVPVLASGFVIAIWLALFLGWVNPRFAGKKVEMKSAV